VVAPLTQPGGGGPSRTSSWAARGPSMPLMMEKVETLRGSAGGWVDPAPAAAGRGEAPFPLKVHGRHINSVRFHVVGMARARCAEPSHTFFYSNTPYITHASHHTAHSIALHLPPATHT
jgi:hypothetical protein